MFTAVLGYSLPVKDLSPRVNLEFDYASGDQKPGGNVGTFNQLFPNGHSYLGYIQYIPQADCRHLDTLRYFDVLIRHQGSNPIETLSRLN
jgi:Alginate export